MAMVVDRQSGSALSANADDAAAMLVRAVKRYGSGQSAVVALDDVTIAFPAGKFRAVMGPSGVHDVMDHPSADSMIDLMKGLGR